MKNVKALTLAAVVVTLSRVALADPPVAPAPAPAPSATPSWLAPSAPAYTAPERSTSGWRTFGAFALLAGLGGYALYARRRRKVPSQLADVPALKVLETARIGRDGQLVVAEVFGQVMLLGVTSQSIRRIATLPRPADFKVPDTKLAEATSKPLPRSLAASLEEPQPFAAALKSLLGGAGRGAERPVDDADDNAAVALAERTVDSVDRRVAAASKRAVEAPKPAPVEGQAAGLRRKRG